MTSFVRVAVTGAMAVTVALAGCGDDVTPPEEETQETGLEAQVTADGAALEGATARLYEVGGATARETQTTGSDGVASFLDLAAGSYELEVEVPTGLELAQGETDRRSATVTEGEVNRVAFGLVTPGGDDVVEIRIVDNRFEPADVTIAPGTTVRWVSTTSTFHTVTPDGHAEWTRAEFNAPNETLVHVFELPGQFPYFCEPHESVGMAGTVTVQ